MKKFLVAAAIAGFALFMYSDVAKADEYDALRAGHPLRIVGYVAHPVGVALDYLLFRPCHWLVHRKGLKTIFGHDAGMERVKMQQPYVRPPHGPRYNAEINGEAEEKDTD